MNTHATPAPVAIGTPVYSFDRIGHVCGVKKTEREGRSFVIGQGMQPILDDLEIVFENGTLTTVPDGIAAPWLERAARLGLPAITPEEAAERRAAGEAAQARTREDSRRIEAETQEKARAFREEARARMPADAEAVLVGELVEDKSDSMSDYFGHTVTRVVILAWSTHGRDIFSEMRKAARNHPETAFLADAPENAEHREKYSMGAGYYLKQGWRDSDGWRVRKVRLYDKGADNVPVGEWSLPSDSPATQPAAGTASTSARIEEHTHTKGGFQMWVVTMGDRVEREEFDRLLNEAKARGGWYSRKWGTTPAGFAFKAQAKAEEFAGLLPGPEADQSTPAAPAAPRPAASGSGVAAKLREGADRLQRDIDDKFRDRLTNTPKRQREAQSARLDGYRLQRTQQAMRALADHYDAGTVPAELKGVTTKAAIFELARGEIVSSGGYYDAGRETGKPARSDPATLALWSMISGRSDEDRAADELREKIAGLQFANIPGYFPTPAAVVARMLDAADLFEGCSVLEPSAGSGAILDELKAHAPPCSLVIYERHHTLRQILIAKGYRLDGVDFTESDTSQKVDRVLMNPPFENGQDADHVRRAFGHLKPGGRLVAIMSPGPFFRSDSRSVAFRAWFDQLGGEKVDLPAGSFKESGTGTATVLVVLEA